MRVRVKICGLTNREDALAAVQAGADALGFMFFSGSPRCLTRPHAADIIRTLPPFVARVGVFVNPLEADVRAAIAECGLDTLQFHGEEAPGFCRQFGLKVIKAFRMRDASSLAELKQFPTEAWLLDSYVPGQRGGTGATFNWDLAAQAVQRQGRVILAGGLTAENVGDAVKRVRPYAVDVSSGVESAPGRKDAGKVAAFINAVRRVDVG